MVTIGEILEALKQPGITVDKIAKEKFGISGKKLRASLNAAGYEFRNKGEKGWFYIGEGGEPLSSSVSEYITSSNTGTRTTSRNSNSQVKVNSPIDPSNNITEITNDNNLGELSFTKEEAAALKSMIQEYMTEKRNQTDRDRLHVRIMKLEKEGRTRKTVLMSESVGKKFDDFAEKMRFNKSDILELALMDFISSYESEEE